MAHIQLPAGIPGIIGPMKAFPEMAKPLNELAEKLLCQETPGFSKRDRELVANYVSYLNGCVFCSESHAAVADFHADSPGFSKKVWQDLNTAPVTEKVRSLLRIAEQVQKTPARVSEASVKAARDQGATDQDIHDTVLIAAAFCMYNRYVDGLATMAPPRGDAAYAGMGKMLGTRGYIRALD